MTLAIIYAVILLAVLVLALNAPEGEQIDGVGFVPKSLNNAGSNNTEKLGAVRHGGVTKS